MRQSTTIACADVRITLLVDNHAAGGLAGEHGFAAWIEVPGRTILFDTGQGEALFPNAALLGCEPGRVDTVVLSHGHYDHSGALCRMLHDNPACQVFCHAGAPVPRYSVRPGEDPRLIAMAPANQAALLALPPDRVHWIDGPCRLLPGVGLSGPIPRVQPQEDTGGPFFLDPAGERCDPIEDDLALWIDTDRGLLIVTGCCHSGLINTVEHIRSVTGVDKLFGIIGGLHLVNAGHERLETTCSALRAWAPHFVMPCHCTGEQAVRYLGDALGPMVVPGYAGLEFAEGQCRRRMVGRRRFAGKPQ